MLTKVKTVYVRRIFKHTEDGKSYIIVDCDPSVHCTPDDEGHPEYCSPDWYGDTCGPDEEEHEY